MTATAADGERVVLLDERGTAIGTAPKASVHTARTPLHRAFSCYLFNPSGRLLLTQRSARKQTFPGLWTNSVCGHPAPGESDHDAIVRRARQELGLAVEDLTVALPHFRYRAESGGIVENEICPVYLGTTRREPSPHPAEVGGCSWTAWPRFLEQLAATPGQFSPWCREQAHQMHSSGLVTQHLARTGSRA